MNEQRLSRLFWLSGVLFVVLELAGTFIGRELVTMGDPTAKIVKTFSDTAGGQVWVGRYLELISLVAFVVFAATLFRTRRDVVSTAGLLVAACFAAVTAVSLAVGGVLEYRAGHGLGAQGILVLFDLESALYFASWGLAAGFLVLAPVAGWWRRSAIAIAALSLVGLAMPTKSPGQFSVMLFLIWILALSLSRARSAGAAVEYETRATGAPELAR
ncbi:MAG: hypothetical protein ACJ77Z_09825 [Thermoleophilaceae bacterium]